jgi:ABC-type nitrate/sulfonate/bicarbonate transport system ATPase subunit
MDLNIHFVDQASGFPWNSLIGPALQLIIGGVSVCFVTWYKGTLDSDAEEKKRVFDVASQTREGEISIMLQAHKKEMDKQKTRYEADLERVTLHFQAHYTYVAERRIKALETFLEELEKIRLSIRLDQPGFSNDDIANRRELDGKLISLWEKHRVSRLFLSKDLTAAIFSALQVIEQLHTTSGEFASTETMDQMRKLKKELEQRTEAIISEAQTIWDTKPKREEARS